MARYIDADALSRTLRAEMTRISNENESISKSARLSLIRWVTDRVYKSKTVDVAEVVHGKNISKSGFLCSVCKFGDFDGFHGYEPNFCPNCGADMRGGQNELHKRL